MIEFLLLLFSLPPLAIFGLDDWVVAMIVISVLSSVYAGVTAAKASKAAKRANKDTTKDRALGSIHQVRSGTFPRRLVYGRDRVGGLEVYFASSGPDNQWIHYIFYWCEGPIKAIEGILFGNLGVELVPIDADNPNILVAAPGTQYEGCLRIESELGNLSQPPHGVGLIPGWNATEPHTDLMVGCAYSWIEFKFNEGRFPDGLPDVSAIINGFNNIMDVRGDEGLKYTNNPALCMAHYMTLPKLGPGLDLATEIAEDELIAAANHCEEQVDSPKQGADSGDSSGGSGNYASREMEFRYTFNGVISLDQEPSEIIDRFRMSMAGVTVPIGGKLRIYAGVYQTPTFTITKDMIVGPVKRRTRNSKMDRLNIVKGVYANDFTRWVGTDFPAVKVQEYIDIDGMELPEDIDLLDCDSPYRAQRIAMIFLKRSRYGREVDLICNIEAWQAQSGLTVYFHFPEIGFTNVPMEVATIGLSIQEGGEIQISLSLRETNAAIYGPVELIDPKVVEAPILKKPLPIPPDFGDLFTEYVPANLLLYEKLRGGIAELCGLLEFIPSSPPRRYRKRVLGQETEPDLMVFCDYDQLTDCPAIVCPGNFVFSNASITVPGSAYEWRFAGSIVFASSAAGMDTYNVQCTADNRYPPGTGTWGAVACQWNISDGVTAFNRSTSTTFTVPHGSVWDVHAQVDFVGYKTIADGCITAGILQNGFMDYWQAVEQYDRITCAYAVSGTKERRVSSLNCPVADCANCDPPGTLSCTDPLTCYENVSATTERLHRVTHGNGCFYASNGHWAMITGAVGETLSDEDTPADAKDRLIPTLPSWDTIDWALCILGNVCALSNWNPVNEDTQFGYQEAKGRVIPVSGLTAGVKYMLRVEIWEGDLVTLAVTPFEIREFLIDGFGFDVQFNMPNNPNKSYYLYKVRAFKIPGT